MTNNIHRVRTPFLPSNSRIHSLLEIFDGVAKKEVLSLRTAIQDATGTPQKPLDWTDPDTWIDERLTGENALLAHRIWSESKKSANPRHLSGGYLFINTFDLLEPDPMGIYRLTDRGRRFLSNDTDTIRELDDLEGMIKLLNIIAIRGRVRQSDILQEWHEYLLANSNYKTDSTAKDTLRRRLRNLSERGLLLHEGIYYQISPTGLEHIGNDQPTGSDNPVEPPRHSVITALSEFNALQRKTLRERLSVLHPYKFEGLVRDLLESMGYEDVEVTKESGDKGVDVVAKVHFGITTITEVVQVKRHQANIQRPILDQLRGALPYHKALRGTIITLGKFSPGCVDAALFPGAAPIGLIDGEKLLDLLMENEIGIRKRPAVMYEIDEEMFREGESGDVEEGDNLKDE